MDDAALDASLDWDAARAATGAAATVDAVDERDGH
jgi:hypothetical protein